MAIDSPATYAEWYWKNSVDASLYHSEELEKTFTPTVSGIVSHLQTVEELPDYVRSFLSDFQTPKHPGWETCWVRFLAEIGGGLTNRVLNHELKGFDYKMNSYLQNVLITPDVANALMMRNKISEELWLSRQNSAGLKEVEANFIYESQKPYPTLPDIITYARYHSDPDNPKELTWKLFDISELDWDLWDWLSWQKLTTEQVQTLYKRKYRSDIESNIELARLGWNIVDRPSVLDLAYTLPNPMLLTQGALLQDADTKSIVENISKADIHPNYAQIYLDGILTKPATSDLIAYELRHDPSLSNIEREFRRLGIHPNYFGLYKELAYQIPPIADIITMAVREAFTPEIAQRFGQYEGLPSEFVAWAQKKGLSREWAERYWAAHWSLPSPQQGFEMLHRGVINRDELHLLLRALDIMPFWRERLIEISYNPLTRVDIRRMHLLGILTEPEVFQAYKDIGYNDLNAKRLTAFTVKLTQQTLAKEQKKAAKTS